MGSGDETRHKFGSHITLIRSSIQWICQRHCLRGGEGERDEGRGGEGGGSLIDTSGLKREPGNKAGRRGGGEEGGSGRKHCSSLRQKLMKPLVQF